jgi:hypothetical protein
MKLLLMHLRALFLVRRASTLVEVGSNGIILNNEVIGE